MRKRLVLAAVLALCATAFAAPPTASLETAKVAYERGDFRGVISSVRPLLYPSIELNSEAAVIEAHRLLGLCHFFLKQESQADEEFSAALALQPALELDPMIDPPQAVRFFQNVKRKQAAELAKISERQQREVAAQHQRAADAERQSHRTVEKHSRIIATIPFGVGQWQNGEHKKAIAFGVTEGVLGATSLGLFIGINWGFPNGRVAPSDRTEARALLGTQLATGALFWAVVAGGIIDAHVRYRPTAPLPVASKTTFHFFPVVSASNLGVGMQGAF